MPPMLFIDRADENRLRLDVSVIKALWQGAIALPAFPGFLTGLAGVRLAPSKGQMPGVSRKAVSEANFVFLSHALARVWFFLFVFIVLKAFLGDGKSMPSKALSVIKVPGMTCAGSHHVNEWCMACEHQFLSCE
jgi:hypothetical protein